MSKAAKIWLIVAISLILVGGILFIGVMSVLKWDFKKLSTNKYETNTYEIKDDFKSILINTDTADITFVPSNNSKCSVVCYEEENANHSVSVKDGALTVKLENNKKWYEYIGINFGSPKITVYIPEGEYGALTIKTSTGKLEMPNDFSFESIDVAATTGHVKNCASATGDIKIKTSTGGITLENVTASSLDLSVSTGDITVSGAKINGNITVHVTTGKAHLTDVTCKHLVSSGDTGDIILKNVITAENLTIERSTGDVKFERCDAAEIWVITDTGDVTGSLLSDKIFFANSDTGKVSVPKTASGGKCEIRTDTGDIKITVE